MVFAQRVRVHVLSDGDQEPVVETVRGKLRSRLLTRLCGNQYSVLVLLPRGMNVEAVEVVETGKPLPGDAA